MSMTATALRTSNIPHGHTAEVSDHTTPSPSATSITSISQSSTSAVQAPPTNTLRRLLADQENLRDLAGQLRGIDTRVYGKPVTPEQISYRLNNSTLAPHQDSFYASTRATPQTLATIITDLGFKLPGTADEVSTLATELEQKASLHPLGNFGGGLSWPIPMSRIDQHSLLQFLYSNKTDVPGLPLPHGGSATLGYLLSGSSVTQSDLQDPVKALQKLLDSPKAQALGQAMQTHLHGASSDTSIYEHVLTAIHFGLDPQSTVWRCRNKIGDFDLVHPGHWGQSPSTIVESLSRNLVANGKATADTAKLATHLLLALEAPQFLIKDIPKNVTIGSLAWANLSIAAAAIEAERPGTVSNMTFAEVMTYSTRVKPPPSAPENEKNAALVDWGIAAGILVKTPTDTYTLEQINKVRTAFTERAQKLSAASQVLNSDLPTRKEIALIRLKEIFGDLGPIFELPFLFTDDERANAGQEFEIGHSLLDVAMMDFPNSKPYRTTHSDIPVEKLNNNLNKLGVEKAFTSRFAGAVTKQGDAVDTSIRHMISQLPLEDRKNFEFGKISFFHETSYKYDLGFWGGKKDSTHPGLWLKIERDGKTYAYEINFAEREIKHASPTQVTELSSRKGAVLHEHKQFKPKHIKDADLNEKPSTTQTFDSFNSLRSNLISMAFVQNLGLNDPQIEKAARGQTNLEKIEEKQDAETDFLLNLIPLRSAIINFKNGNYGDGVFDLAIDIFGFVTAGTAVAGKLVKIGNSTFAVGTKALQAAKVIGVATVSALNPLSGAGDLAVGGAHLLAGGGKYLLSKGTQIVNKLKGASGSYDLLKAASKNHGVVATGTFKVAEQTFEGGAVLSNGKWHAYDPITGRAYGPPLPMLTANSVAMAGKMQNFRVLDHGLGMSEDMTKRGLRLTLDAHGVLPPGSDSALMLVNGKHLTPNEVLDHLKASNVDLSKYTEIRLTMCDSGTGARQSFAAQLSKLTHKPTEGFVGVMHTSTEVEDVAARMFKNGGARQREFIEETVIGVKKEVVKYKMTSTTADNRGTYTHSPDYNPVRFDADGNLMAPKPLRTPYTADKVELPDGETKNADLDFSEYDDLT
ncbi:hypothetical protein [Pseudomonas costantinii]|uniref:hypothetical protein n=1 Tax=Pseudomonas costantinii TaxID=168469 RepID=UPI00159FBD46|nr:hypothetical protein [Pseudomonas costantinii]NVZ69179.1 hypothetical protein [Pseudomonas costantinii]